VMMNRAASSARAQTRAGLIGGIGVEMSEGGLARKVITTGSKTVEGDQIKMQTELDNNPGHVWIAIDDAQHLKKLGIADILPESARIQRNADELLEGDNFRLAEVRSQQAAQSVALHRSRFRESTAVPRTDPREIVPGRQYALVSSPMYDEILHTWDKMMKPVELNSAVRLYHTVQNWWKGMSTLPWPSFIFRNIVSDSVFMHFAGFDAIRDGHLLYDATRIHKAVAGAFGATEDLSRISLKTVTGETLDGVQVLSEMMRYGIFSTDALRVELMEQGTIAALRASGVKGARARAEHAADGVMEGVKSIHRHVIDARTSKLTAMQRYATLKAQNTQRGAVYMAMRKNGMNAADAARHTKKYMLDYNSAMLTHTEKKIFRGAVPFYTFWRRNMELIPKQMFGKPGSFSGIGKILRNIDDMAVDEDDNVIVPDKLLPDFVKDMYGIKYKMTKEGPHYLLAKGWLPQADLAEFGEGIRNLWMTDDAGERSKLFRDMLARTTPLLKTPLEMAFNYSTFMGRKIEIFEGQTQEFLGLSLSPMSVHVMRSFRPLAELDRLGIINLETGEVGTDVIPRSGEYGERKQPDWKTRGIAFLTGGKPQPVISHDQWRRFEYENEKRVRDLKGRIRRLARDYKTPNRMSQIKDLQSELLKTIKERVSVGRSFGEFMTKIGKK